MVVEGSSRGLLLAIKNLISDCGIKSLTAKFLLLSPSQ
jgi:hypothetical protein